MKNFHEDENIKLKNAQKSDKHHSLIYKYNRHRSSSTLNYIEKTLFIEKKVNKNLYLEKEKYKLFQVVSFA